MPYTDACKNLMLDANGATYLSLHSDIPNSSGSNELTGGSPAYARKAISYASAGSGAKASSTNPSFDVPAGTVYFLGRWTAITAGTFLGWAPINGGTVKGVGTATTADVITSNGHGLSDTNQITLQAVNGEALPTGLSATVIYFVRDATTDTFKVALTSGGTAVDITAIGELAFQKVIPEVFASQGTMPVTSDTMDLNG